MTEAAAWEKKKPIKLMITHSVMWAMCRASADLDAFYIGYIVLDYELFADIEYFEQVCKFIKRNFF